MKTKEKKEWQYVQGNLSWAHTVIKDYLKYMFESSDDSDDSDASDESSR